MGFVGEEREREQRRLQHTDAGLGGINRLSSFACIYAAPLGVEAQLIDQTISFPGEVGVNHT